MANFCCHNVNLVAKVFRRTSILHIPRPDRLECLCKIKARRLPAMSSKKLEFPNLLVNVTVVHRNSHALRDY